MESEAVVMTPSLFFAQTSMLYIIYRCGAKFTDQTDEKLKLLNFRGEYDKFLYFFAKNCGSEEKSLKKVWCVNLFVIPLRRF